MHTVYNGKKQRIPSLKKSGIHLTQIIHKKQMKKFTTLFIGLFFLGGHVFGQEAQTEKKHRAAVTLGFLQGGGSLVGADFELLVSDRVGLQVGAGVVGLGAAINYHLKPSIRSSMISHAGADL